MLNSECESRPCRAVAGVGALSSEFERGLQLPASASELERPMSNLVMDEQLSRRDSCRFAQEILCFEEEGRRRG